MSTITIDKKEFEKFYRKSVADFTKKYLISDYYKYVVSQTSFLDEVYKDVKLWQRRYHIINGVDHILTCPLCGRPRAVKTDRVGYMKTCDNPTCIGKGRSLSKKKTDKEKYGNENYFLTDDYKRKSKETCLKKYGVEYVTQTADHKKTLKRSPEVYDKIKESQIKKYGDLYVNTDEYKRRSTETNIKKYKVEFPSQAKSVKEKIKKTIKQRYGNENYFLTDDFKCKSKETCLEKYGVEYYQQTEEFKEKSKQTNNERYGVDYYAQTDEYKCKSKETSIERYGVESYSQTEEFKEKSKQTNNERYGNENYFLTDDFKCKSKETCIDRYGVEHYAQSEDWKQKTKETVQQQYGVDNIAQSQYYKDNLEKYQTKSHRTNVERYGAKYYTQSDDYKSKKQEHLEKIKETNLERYGVERYQESEEYKNKLVNSFKQRLVDDGYSDLGYKYVSYKGNREHELYCPHCHNNFVINHDDQYYYRNKNHQEICTSCNPIQKGYSVAEKDLLSYVSSIYSGTIIENDRSAITPYELDIYLPDLCLAIEFNGLYWHSDEQKPNNYHRMKSDLCKEKDIHLIHVFEDDWVNKQSIIKSVISNFVNNTINRRIYARKCEIRAISDKTLINNFLVSNHLLGRTTFISYCAGLYYNDELVSLITMHLLKKAERKWELNRYAIKNGVTIIGGAERLLKHIIQTIDYSSIITYNDNSIFRGLVYKRLGFQYVRTNAPNYMFIQGDCLERFPKQTIRKWNVGYSREMEQQLGLHRVYNAGNDVYILNK